MNRPRKRVNPITIRSCNSLKNSSMRLRKNQNNYSKSKKRNRLMSYKFAAISRKWAEF